MYYGYNVAESWLSRIQNSPNAEWHASTMARVNTHNTKIKNGDIFGDTYVTDPADTSVKDALESPKSSRNSNLISSVSKVIGRVYQLLKAKIIH